MQFKLTDTQRDIQKAAREFAEKEFDSDLALELEKKREFPKSIFEKACRLGFVGIDYPVAYGGQSFGLFENILIVEEFCKKDSGIGISINLADIGSRIILQYGNENQKKNFLTPITQGKAINSVAVMNSLNGDNRDPICTKAETLLSEYVLNGKKVFVVNGMIADYFIVFSEANSTPSFRSNRPTTFLIERRQKGINVSMMESLMGMRMNSLSEIIFDHVRVEKDHMIGEEGEGKEHLNTYLTEHRIKTSAQALGIAQGALDLAIKYAKNREQFGRKISQFQGIQFMIAELFILIEAARSLVYRAAYSFDSKSSDVENISSVARLFATDVAVKTTIGSIQIHGGVGVMREYSIERMFRDAKTIQNLEETHLVQKTLIANSIIPQMVS